MARKTIEKYYSDLSGDEIETGNPSVAFAFGGVSYSVDLTEAERAEFEAVLKPYIAVAGKVGGRRSSRSTAASSGPAAKDVRAWAQGQGMDVPARGRIPANVLEAYEAAH